MLKQGPFYSFAWFQPIETARFRIKAEKKKKALTHSIVYYSSYGIVSKTTHSSETA